jgi:hypothetical protein
MSLISKETLLTHLQRAEMASDVRLPIEFFRDLVYQAMPRTWVGLTDKELEEFSDAKLGSYDLCLEVEAKLKEKNTWLT